MILTTISNWSSQNRLGMVKFRSYPNDTIIIQVYLATSIDYIGKIKKVYEDIEELINQSNKRIISS